MGVTLAAIRLLTELKVGELLETPNSQMIEFGSQDVHFYDESTYQAFFSAFNGAAALPAPIAGAFWSSHKFFEQAGFTYACVDIDGRAYTLPWDINYMKCPADYFGRFGLVTNHGTTEHLIGQSNAFRLIHDLAATGSCMMHTLPCTGGVNHGFFSYSPMFFERLATANDYELVKMNITDLKEHSQPYTSSMAFPSFSYVMVVLRKVRQTPFQPPLQI